MRYIKFLRVLQNGGAGSSNNWQDNWHDTWYHFKAYTTLKWNQLKQKTFSIFWKINDYKFSEDNYLRNVCRHFGHHIDVLKYQKMKLTRLHCLGLSHLFRCDLQVKLIFYLTKQQNSILNIGLAFGNFGSKNPRWRPPWLYDHDVKCQHQF